MKSYNTSVSETSLTMQIYSCSLKLRILALVINTANLINERSTFYLGLSHAVLAPIAIFTTYILLGILVIGALREHYASEFLQVYSLVVCAFLHISLCILVFKSLNFTDGFTNQEIGAVLNGVLPIFIVIVAITDIVKMMSWKRNDRLTPVLPTDSVTALPTIGLKL